MSQYHKSYSLLQYPSLLCRNITSPIHCYNTHHFYVWRGYRTNDSEQARRAETSNAEFLAQWQYVKHAKLHSDLLQAFIKGTIIYTLRFSTVGMSIYPTTEKKY